MSETALPDMRFDIYERVNLADTDNDIEIIEETELTPQIQILLSRDAVQLLGRLLLKIKYVGGYTPWIDNEFQHSIPVEINLPASRVADAWLLDADILNFNVEQMGPRTLNVTGVLKVYEKEQIKVESSKALLPKDVAEELTAIVQNKSYPTSYVIDIFVNEGIAGEASAIKRYFDSDRSNRIAIIMNALVNGYEAEETPEDKVKALYWRLRDSRENVAHNALHDALDILGIRIKGVNA